MVGGINEWALMKIDVLDELETIVCIGYEINGEEVSYIPSNINKFSLCKPIYEELLDGKLPPKNVKNGKIYLMKRLI